MYVLRIVVWLVGLPKVRLSPIQSVLNAAARLIGRLPRTPTSLPSCLTIFIGYHSLLGYNSRFSHSFTARILVKLPGIYVTLVACLPLPSLFVRYAHLTVMISLSRERGLLWLRHEPLQSLTLRFGTNSFLILDPFD